MDPADTEAVRRAISHQQAQLGQHDQALQEITSSLCELSLTITSWLPVTPVPPIPVPSHSASPREPFIPAPERYEGDLGQCQVPIVPTPMLPGVRATAPDPPHRQGSDSLPDRCVAG